MIAILAEAHQTAEATAANAVLFWLFALMAGGAAIAVVVSRNIVRTAVALLFTLMGVAGLYFLLHAEFLAAVQLVVYAGGTLILIIFGVMLTSKNPFMQLKAALWERFVGILIALAIAGLLLLAMVNTQGPPEAQIATRGETALATHNRVAAIGRALLSEYLVPFEVAGVLLLVVMIGAAYLAKARRREETRRARGSATLSRKARQWS